MNIGKLKKIINDRFLGVIKKNTKNIKKIY